MRFKSLRTGIFINLAFLLFLAIALTDLVLLQISEQRMVEQRIDEAKKRLRSIAAAEIEEGKALQIFSLFAEDDVISSALISREGSKTEIHGSLPESLAGEVDSLRRRIMEGRSLKTLFAGKIWGVFWPRNRYALICEPLYENTGLIAVVRLSPVYQAMRDVQHMAVFYLLINLLLLLAFGGWRLSRMLTRPINRLIRITDDYRASEGFDMFPERRNDEFSRLAGALNQMMRRIEADRDELRFSLESLEASNRQLKAAQKEMVRAEKLASTGRLSAGLAHEIGNPIGIVLGYLGLLKARSIFPDDRVARDYIERSEAEIQRVNNIIRQLLDFSRSRRPEFSVISVHELVKYVGGMLSQQPLFSGIEISYQLGADEDRVYGDSDQLHQVLVNLMINAADSIKQSENSENGLIRLATRISESRGRRATDAGKMIELKVIDNGTGIDAQDLDKIFDPFFTTKETGKGTGLGLSVSYMIVEQMGGGINADLPETGGTEIVIRLPVAEEAPQGLTDGKDSDKEKNKTEASNETGGLQ